MRIAFIHPFLFRYARGIERFTFNLANTLARRGIEIHLLTWQWSEPIQIDSVAQGVNVHVFPTSRYYAAQVIVPFYAWDMLTHEYDFAWIFFAGYGEAEALTLARHQRFGIIFQYPFAQVPHRYREFQRFGLAQRASQVVAVSRWVAEGVAQSLERESIVIPNGVDPKRFTRDEALRKTSRLNLGLNDYDQILLSVAALEERKGIQHVINALPHVVNSYPQIKYWVIGEGQYRSQLEKQISALGLESIVKLIAPTNDVFLYFNVADIFILLSQGEALPIAPLEAMAMELPLIVACQPPFDEVASPACGVRVNPTDSAQVAEAIINLLSSPERRREMGEAGRARILADFTWERVGEKYLRLLNLEKV